MKTMVRTKNTKNQKVKLYDTIGIIDQVALFHLTWRVEWTRFVNHKFQTKMHYVLYLPTQLVLVVSIHIRYE